MKKILIIDSNAIIHRAFHALPPLKTKKGEVVGAVYGFLLALFKAVDDFKPDYIAATFDFPAPTFRHKEYKEYKATRVKAPDELYDQIPKVKSVLSDLGISVFEKEGFEADDLIGTISKLSKLLKIESVVLTGDLDMLQLVDRNISVNMLRKGIKDTVLYSKEEVKERYGGLLPRQLADYKGLRGDPSDNIPGVAGIGEKTAISLLLKYESIDGIYDKINEIEGKLKDNLIEFKEDAYLSKKLGTIKRDVDIIFDLEKCVFLGYNNDKTKEVLKRYNFKTLIKRLFKEKEKTNLKLL